MQLGMCCCGGALPCLGCGNRRFNINWDKIGLTHSGFSGFAYNDDDSESCDGTNTHPDGDYDWFGSQYYKSPNDIPTSLDLWRQPEGAISNGYGAANFFGQTNRCQWLWNSIKIYEAVTHRFAQLLVPFTVVHSEAEVVHSYTPENATDPANPWNRVITSPTDSRCGTKVIAADTSSGAVRWGCHSLEAYTSISLARNTITVETERDDVITATVPWYADPEIVGNIFVECWGGGGGGGGTDSNSGSSPGGGGGGAYAAKSITPTPSASYTATVGTGGAGGTSSVNGADGGDTWFGTSTNVKAVGGKGGQSATLDDDEAGGTGGLSTSSIGTTRRSGGAGANGLSGSYSGGGGSSAGSAASGVAATNGTGATAPTGGGNGGNQGTAGDVPGGGGGGAIAGSDSSGGNGANGRIRIRYTTAVQKTVWEARVAVVFATVRRSVRSWSSGLLNEYDWVQPVFDTNIIGVAGDFSCFQFENVGAGAGAVFAIYRKEIDCDADFNGDPIVLDFIEDGFSEIPRRHTQLGITCPETMSLTLIPE